MTFLELARERCSTRAYRPDAVEDDKINYILEAARIAPSAVNFQPWRLIVIKSEAARKNVQACYPRDWFTGAPLYIAVCTDRSTAWVRKTDGKSHADIDAAIIAEHICLAAADAGLGSCWVCNFDPALFRLHFRLPDNTNPVAIIPIGYPAQRPEHASARKPVEEIVSIV